MSRFRCRNNGLNHRRRLRDSSSRQMNIIICAILKCFFLQETKDIIEDKVPIRLFSEEKSLNKFTPWITMI
jgi:hypothetical protein